MCNNEAIFNFNVCFRNHMLESRKKTAVWMLGLLILVVTVSQAIWIAVDTRPHVFGDPYVITTIRSYDQFSAKGPAAVFDKSFMRMRLWGRPILYQLMAMPLIPLLGRDEDPMIALNLLFYVVLMVSVYRATALIKNPGTGLLAAVIVSVYPPVISLLKCPRPHALLPACTALVVWGMVSLLKNPSRKTAWGWGAALGLSAWVHPNGIFLLGPLSFLFGIYFLCAGRCEMNTAVPSLPRRIALGVRSTFFWKGLVPGALVAFGLTALWYVPNFKPLYDSLGYAERCCRDGGISFFSVSYSPLWYLKTMPGALSNYFAALLLISLVAFLFSKNRERRLLSVGFIILAVLITGRPPAAFSWVYFAVNLPVAAIATALFVTDARDWLMGKIGRGVRIFKIVGNGFLTVTIIYAAFNFYVLNAPLPAWANAVAGFSGSPKDGTCAERLNVAYCPNPPLAEDWRIPEVLTVIGRDPRCLDRNQCTVTMVSEIMAEEFHHGMLAFFLIRDFPRINIKLSGVVLVLSETGDLVLDHTLDWLSADYVAYIPGYQAYPYDGAVARLLERETAAPSFLYEIAAVSVLPKGRELKL
ncbi:MAG TPA: glycosyltransferase family 39 protein, partial [Candidatus Bathyarchaeia archaeon]|nr:glycosyltransferase family 39 protein [Candidatus Bathyarchaeia archaeon]